MPIPDYQTLMGSVLQAAIAGEVRISEVIEKLADEHKLSDAERARMLPSGRITLFANRVHWAKAYLKQAGLIQQTRRAHFRLSDRGKTALASGVKIDNRYLAQFPEFQEFKVSSKQNDSVDEGATVTTLPEPTSTATPDEVMRAAYSQVTDQLREELLERVLESSPVFFEKLIVVQPVRVLRQQQTFIW